MAAPDPNPAPARSRDSYADLAANPLGPRGERIVREAPGLKQQYPHLYYRDGYFNADQARAILVPRASKGYGTLHRYRDAPQTLDPESPARSIGGQIAAVERARRQSEWELEEGVARHLRDWEAVEAHHEQQQDRKARQIQRLGRDLARDRSPRRQ